MRIKCTHEAGPLQQLFHPHGRRLVLVFRQLESFYRARARTLPLGFLLQTGAEFHKYKGCARMGGSFVLTHSQHTVQCASKYNLELKETEIFLKMIPLLISINIIPSEEKCSPTASSSRATSEEEGNWRGCEGLKVSKSILLISQARRRKEMGALGYIQPSITLK